MEALGRHEIVPVPTAIGFETNRAHLGERFYVMGRSSGNTGQLGLEWMYAIGEDGYPKTTVAGIVRRARTSRRTFYEHFTSKEDCFVALHTDANLDMIRQIVAAVERTAPWQNQVRHAVGQHCSLPLLWSSECSSASPLSLSRPIGRIVLPLPLNVLDPES